MKQFLIKAGDILVLIISLLFLIAAGFICVVGKVPVYNHVVIGAIIFSCIGIITSFVSLSIKRNNFEIKPKDVEHSIDKSVLLSLGCFGFAVIAVIMFFFDNSRNVVFVKLMSVLGFVFFVYKGIQYLKDNPKSITENIHKPTEIEPKVEATKTDKSIWKVLEYLGAAILFFIIFIFDKNGPHKIIYIIGFVCCLFSSIYKGIQYLKDKPKESETKPKK